MGATAATAPRRSDVPPTGARAARVSDLLAAPFAVAVDVSRAPCLPGSPLRPHLKMPLLVGLVGVVKALKVWTRTEFSLQCVPDRL